MVGRHRALARRDGTPDKVLSLLLLVEDESLSASALFDDASQAFRSRLRGIGLPEEALVILLQVVLLVPGES